MKDLRRIIMSLMIAVAALAAVHTVPSFADITQATMAAQPCHCADGCAPDAGACKEQGSCAATCASAAMVADIGFATPMIFTRHLVPGVLSVAHDPVLHPPPLQPPTA